MKIKTVELTGAALNWAVAQALGHEPVYNMESHGLVWRGWWERTPKTPTREYRQLVDYSTDWSQGGPIIDRLHIRTEWSALWECWLAYDLRHAGLAFPGATRLIAAMRCYVASKLGDEVDIPEELLQ